LPDLPVRIPSITWPEDNYPDTDRPSVTVVDRRDNITPRDLHQISTRDRSTAGATTVAALTSDSARANRAISSGTSRDNNQGITDMTRTLPGPGC
jgi:hypothetical protein